ncbi:uncharacterized protein EHS24_002600 [Apiotrichum porosum]|uniref:Uncharacterized protein n=1 Tax=Apiotrichum porosum TaxID=105984 RepID=A0A427XHF1_9TREE|nr:uncharacterized protein EHS24_002600 [Apiotrichum porosum]RSH78144.1 hypothetical protein EHS24_002600 [Apiotrichum porosum]
MPTDIHPLPDDITAYFVYPFTLEQHVVSLTPPPHIAIAERRARLAAILHAREVEEEQREKAALHRLAPGYNPASVLTPTHAGGAENGVGGVEAPGSPKPADPMDDLVAQLEEMESSRH